jgi:hypothetical protein
MEGHHRLCVWRKVLNIRFLLKARDRVVDPMANCSDLGPMIPSELSSSRTSMLSNVHMVASLLLDLVYIFQLSRYRQALRDPCRREGGYLAIYHREHIAGIRATRWHYNAVSSIGV